MKNNLPLNTSRFYKIIEEKLLQMGTELEFNSHLIFYWPNITEIQFYVCIFNMASIIWGCKTSTPTEAHGFKLGRMKSVIRPFLPLSASLSNHISRIWFLEMIVLCLGLLSLFIPFWKCFSCAFLNDLSHAWEFIFWKYPVESIAFRCLTSNRTT